MQTHFTQPAAFASSALAATAMLLGCTGADSGSAADASSLEFTASDSAGVEILVTRAPDPPPSSGWVIGTEPDVVFGAAESPPVEFFRVAGMQRLADGRVVVLDEGDMTLRYFSATGELEREVGREGDGPGEFRHPVGPAVMPGDTVLVFDKSLLRFSFFGPDGSFIRTQRLDPPPEEGPSLHQYTPAEVVGDTVLMIATSWMVPYREERRYTHEVPNLRYLIDGSYVGEVAEPTVLEFERTDRGVDVPLFAMPRTAVAQGGGVYAIDRGAYEIRMYPHDGGLARIYRLERSRLPVTEAEVEAHVQRSLERVEDPDRRRRILERNEGRARADSFPLISDLHVDTGGNLWVTEYRTPTEWAAVTAATEVEMEAGEGAAVEAVWRTVAVFAADGRWLGTAEVPPGFQPYEIGDDYALGVILDELGVQRPVMYPVSRN